MREVTAFPGANICIMVCSGNSSIVIANFQARRAVGSGAAADLGLGKED